MIDDAEFDRLLDEHQEQERQAAAASAREGDRLACRPGAERVEIAFAELCLGDFITAESGPQARWVEVVDVETVAADELKVTFATPRPLGVGRHERFVMRRRAAERVVVDAAARGERHWRGKDSRSRLSSLAE